MNDQFLTGMNRRSRTAVELRRKSLRRGARDGLQRLLGAVDALVAADGSQTVTDFREAQDAPALIEAAIACRAFERLETRGHLDAMAGPCARRAQVRSCLERMAFGPTFPGKRESLDRRAASSPSALASHSSALLHRATGGGSFAF
jgi:hypothetical protein